MKKILVGILALGSLSAYASEGTLDILNYFLSNKEVQEELLIMEDMTDCKISQPIISSMHAHNEITADGMSYTNRYLVTQEVECKVFANSISYVIEKKKDLKTNETSYALKIATIKY